MMIRLFLRTLTTLAVAVSAAPAALAQQAATPSAPSAGWTLTPSLRLASGWDDNVLLRGRGDRTPSDLVNTVNPRADLDFIGRRGQFAATYDGAFLLHRDLNALNSYDQRGSFSGRRLLSPHLALVARAQTAVAPTSELMQLVGVPYVRTGSAITDVRGGVEAELSKRTSVGATYNFQVVRFSDTQPVADLLRGGHSHGGTVEVRHRLSERTALTADYDLQRAVIGEFGEAFDLQRATLGVDYQLSPASRVFGALGVSHLGVSAEGPARLGPRWRAGFTRDLQSGGIDVIYSRALVPSYGFGGTLQNEELTLRTRLPLPNPVVAQSSVSWHRNEPLTAGAPKLSSLWVQASVGYMPATWGRIEAFYDGIHQSIARPGGIINRHRFGLQFITAKPLRIR